MVRKLQAGSAQISQNLDIVAKLPVSSAQISRNLDIVAKLQASSAQIFRNLDIGPAFARIFDAIREKYPSNWPTDIDLERVTSVVQDDGLPIVWVPRAEIVKMLLAAEDRSARVDVLLGHIPELIAGTFLAKCHIVRSPIRFLLPLEPLRHLKMGTMKRPRLWPSQ